MPKCSEHVYHGSGCFSVHQCARNGVVERDGKFYCRQHDPVAVRQREDDRRAKWRGEWATEVAARKEADRLAALHADALAAIREIAAGHNDPRALAAATLAKHGEADHAE